MKTLQPILLAVFSLLILSSSCSKKDKVDTPKATIIYQTNFDSDDGQWSIGNFDKGNSAEIKGGYYQLLSGSIGQDYWIPSIFTGTVAATAIETSFKLTSKGDEYDGNGGLIWGYNEAHKTRFYFSLSSNGQYSIYGYPDGTDKSMKVYKDWTLNSAVKKDQFNQVRIELINAMLHFYINDTEVYKMTANSSGTLDQTGLTIYSNSAMQVDYFKAAELQ